MSATRQSTDDEIKKVLTQAKSKVSTAIYNTLVDSAWQLISESEFAAEYHDVTGNTFTSYVCGVFKAGKLKMIATSRDKYGEPTRMTLVDGEYYDLAQYWGGDDVTPPPYKGSTGDESYFGWKRALEFINGFKVSNSKAAYSLVMCTGTDYSLYLEKEYDLNVLTDQMQSTEFVVIRNLKKVK